MKQRIEYAPEDNHYRKLSKKFANDANVKRTKEERKIRIEKILEGMRKRIEGGFRNGGHMVRGYSRIFISPKIQEVKVNAEGELLGQAFKKSAEGLSDVQIMRWLRDKGMEVCKSSLGYILRNIFYTGNTVSKLFPGRLFTSTHPAIVDEETFSRVSERRRQKSNRQRTDMKLGNLYN